MKDRKKKWNHIFSLSICTVYCMLVEYKFCSSSAGPHLSSCWHWQSCRTRGSTRPQVWRPSRSLSRSHTESHRRWQRRRHRRTRDKVQASRCRCDGRPPRRPCSFPFCSHLQLLQKTKSDAACIKDTPFNFMSFTLCYLWLLFIDAAKEMGTNHVSLWHTANKKVAKSREA